MPNRIIAPNDVEDVLQQDLSTLAASSGFSFGISGSPVPSNLGTSLPWVVVYNVGGFRTSKVVDTHAVSIDVYADRWDLAMDAANKMVGLVESLEDSTGLSIDYHRSAVTALPYNNPDPRHEDIPRVSFTADVVLRAAVI